MGRGVWYRIRTLLRGRHEEAEMAEEMDFHLEMEARKLERAGRSADEARREARRRFGGVERMKERTRDERGTRGLEDVLRDVRYAVRALRRAPGFTAVAALTLSLGVGATTAMYTLVDGVLLRPLPYPEADRLVSVWERGEDGAALPTSYLNFADWRRGSTRVEALAAFVPPRATTVLTPVGGVRARLTSVSADFFQVAGVEPVRGRLPGADEHRAGGTPVAVVSEGFWRNVLGGGALDRTGLDVLGTVYDVVGVMPAGFSLPDGAEVWTSLDRAVPWTVRGNHVVQVMGRLAPGATVADAGRELEAVHQAIAGRYPEVETEGVTVRPHLDEVVGDAGRALGLLLAAAAVLLLVACTNLASTLLARGAGRVRELGVRASLGAGRPRLVRQLFLESLTLAVLGAGGGLATAGGLLALTRALDAGAVPRLAEVSIDPGVLVFTMALTVLTALLFGLLPALSLTRGDVAGAVRGGRSGYDRGTRAVWRVIMGAEVALAVVLLVGGGLVLRSLDAILHRDGGFRTEGVVTGRLDLPTGKYASMAEAMAVVDGILSGVRSGTGVSDAGVTLLLPVPGTGGVGSQVELPGGDRSERWFAYRVADAGYFRTLGIPLVRGRLFGTDDGPGAPHVAVVDQAMADALWPGEDPLGRTFNPRGMDPYRDHDLTVIGVVGEAVRWDRQPGSDPGYYVHYRQRPTFLGAFGMSVVAAVDDVGAGAAHVRETVRRVDRDAPVQVSTLAGQIAGSAAERRFAAFVLSGFAVVALLLAALGVYGVVSYAVARRTREMGIRMALGASRRSVRGTVQSDVLVTVALGIAAGVGAALVLSRSLEAVLFEVSPRDPATLTAAVAVLAAAAWVASWIPAWRGTLLPPARVLHEE